MYEHPIKRAGLSMNRIIFSNTRMVASGFPKLNQQQFDLSFKFRTYENAKVVSTKCKCTPPSTHAVDYTSKDLDGVLPSRKQE